MIDKTQLLNYIIAPALNAIDRYSDDACMLLYCIAKHESTINGVTYIKQIGGPALGIYQMEPATYNDIWDNWLGRKTELRERILITLGTPKKPVVDRLTTDLLLATIMARAFFLRLPAALPRGDDVEAMANYWKKYYNTHLGKGKVADFIRNNGGIKNVDLVKKLTFD